VAGTAEEAVAKATEGAILVTKTTDKEYMPAIETVITSSLLINDVASAAPTITGIFCAIATTAA
jgi:phosphohistidine swiveling domain-containing protein